MNQAPVGVGVGVLVLRDDGALLLGRRLGAHGAGTWAAPGGKLEFGEQVLDCAARELLEETGLVMLAAEIGPYSNDAMRADGLHHITLFVRVSAFSGVPQAREPDKCAAWQWFAPGSLPQPLFQPLASLLASGYQPGAGRCMPC